MISNLILFFLTRSPVGRDLAIGLVARSSEHPKKNRHVVMFHRLFIFVVGMFDDMHLLRGYWGGDPDQ